MKTEKKTILATRVEDSVPSTTSCSHLIFKAYKFRIYPNAEQRTLLAKHFGCCRFIYNKFLEERNRVYKETGKGLSLFETHRQMSLMRKTEGTEWLAEVYSHALQAELRNLDSAFRNLFRKTGKFPQFHGKHDKQSVTFPDNVKVIGGKLALPKFKKPIKMKMHRPIIGKICKAIVSQDVTGRYYVSICCEETCETLPPTGKEVGIDLGIKDMAVCSNGERIANPKFFEKGEKHLKYLQRQISKKKKGSNRRRRARLRLAQHHKKVANRRKDYTHKITTRIVRENQTVCVEDLNVKGMQSNHHLARSIGSVAFGEIVRQLEYKCAWYGRGFVKVGRFYPSSKTCNHCGHVNHELTLKDREWVCEECGAEIDRDYNAAMNILAEGKRILSGDGALSDIKQKGGEAAA